MREILDNFLTVANQVLVLFLLITVGFICGKIKYINDTVSEGLGKLVMYFSTPAVIISSFFRPFDSKMLKNLLISFAVAFAFHFIAFAVSLLLKTKTNDNRVARFAVVFSNAGYMSLPLQLALLGDEGSFYGSAYVVVFNIVVWTYGILLMGGKSQKLTAKKLIFNPGVISIIIGLILFLFNIAKYLPDAVQSAFTGVAALNTPLPMFIIGYHLSKAKILSAFSEKKLYFPSFLRLIFAPAVCLLFLWVFRIEYTVAIAFIIAASAPVAAMTTIFAANFGEDTAFSVKTVTVTTLLSIITMPAFVALAQVILK